MAPCFKGKLWFARVSHQLRTEETNPDILMFATPLTFRLSIIMQFGHMKRLTVMRQKQTYRSQMSADGLIVYQETCFEKGGEKIVRHDCLLGTLRERPRGDPALCPNVSEVNLRALYC